eukprot:IDg4272t1
MLRCTLLPVHYTMNPQPWIYRFYIPTVTRNEQGDPVRFSIDTKLAQVWALGTPARQLHSSRTSETKIFKVPLSQFIDFTIQDYETYAEQLRLDAIQN